MLKNNNKNRHIFVFVIWALTRPTSTLRQNFWIRSYIRYLRGGIRVLSPILKSIAMVKFCSNALGDNHFCRSRALTRPIPWNYVESDLGCTSRIYFDNVTLTLYNVTLTSQKPCQHNNKCDCSKTNGYK